MGVIFDKINAEVAAREQIAAQAKSLEAARLARAGKARLEVSRDEMNARAAVAAKTRSIRAIRCQAAAALGVLPSFDLYVPRLDADFRVEFHRPNSGPGRAFINAKGCHQTYLRATNLSTNKVHVWNGARKERFQCPNMPTRVRTGTVIGTDENGAPIYEIVENSLEAAQAHFRHAALLGITAELARDSTPEFGKTTLVVYPDAGSGGGGTTDGLLKSFNSNQAWATHHDASVATSVADTIDGSSTSDSGPYIISGTTSSKWTALYRSAFSFDTSGVGGGTISSSTFSQFTHAKVDNFTTPAAPVTHLRGQTLAANDALAVGDFDGGGGDDFATLTWASVGTGQYNDYALNATGIAAIVTDGVTAFSLRYSYDVNDSPPTWESGKVVRTSSYFADYAGTANDPKLTIEYAAAAASGGMSLAMKMALGVI